MDAFAAAPVTYILILINVVASFLAFSNRAVFDYGVFEVGAVVKRYEVHRLVTSAFLHASPTHLMVNMLTLYFFGPALESPVMLGAKGFVLVYVGALLAGGLWSLVENLDKPDYAAVGASGAVSGVVLAFCLFQPFAMLLVFFILPMPAILFAVLYIGYSAFASGDEASRIGHEAHLGGAIAGLLITMTLHPGLLNGIIARLTGAG